MNDASANPDREKLELGDIIVVEAQDGKELEFEVVGIVGDEEADKSYVICYSSSLDTPADDPNGEESQPFIVTDIHGDLLSDIAQAQTILDDFLNYLAKEEEGDEGAEE